MRRNFVFIGILLGFLLLDPPAFAISYSNSVLLDWNGLTFSGIRFEPSEPGFGAQGDSISLTSVVVVLSAIRSRIFRELASCPVSQQRPPTPIVAPFLLP